MCMYIGIEDLAANALIRLLSQAQGNDNTERFVRFATLYNYGMKVIQQLTQQGTQATLIYNRESNSRIFRNYSTFFDPHTDEEGYDGIMLRKGIEIKDIMRQFLGQIPVVVQNVLADREILDQVLKLVA